MSKQGSKLNKAAVYTLFQYYKDKQVTEFVLDDFLNFLKIPGTPISKQFFKQLDF